MLVFKHVLLWILYCFAFQSFAQQCDSVKLEQAEQKFVSMLGEKETNSGDPGFTEKEYQSAAIDFVSESEKCYVSLVRSAQSPIHIDDGALIPVLPNTGPSEFTLFPNENKWGASSILGTPAGTISYSFIADGIVISDNNNPSMNTAITSLTNYQECFIAEIVAAFAAWGAIADIDFVQVTDNSLPTNNPAASGLIRIGAHVFDGVSGTLAHAWAPLLQSQHSLFADAGDMHFDVAENWTCDTTGIDIGIVAIHELGHSIGLDHSNSMQAIMAPFYNGNLTSLQQDDRNGAVTLYGPKPTAESKSILIKYHDYLVPILKRED